MELVTLHGYNLYDVSSMLQKAIRRGDIFHAAYAAKEMYSKYNNYMWKRLLTVSAEDCYGIITKEIVALQQADEIIRKGKGSGEIFAAKAVTLLCMTRKNRDADYVACNFMYPDRNLSPEEIKEFEFGQLPEHIDFPQYVFDCHTKRGKANGKTKVDMIMDEQNALSPHQISLFDDGDWKQYIDQEKKYGRTNPRTERQYISFSGTKTRYDQNSYRMVLDKIEKGEQK